MSRPGESLNRKQKPQLSRLKEVTAPEAEAPDEPAGEATEPEAEASDEPAGGITEPEAEAPAEPA